MTNAEIESIALDNGFKLKRQPDGSMALNPYVFEFARKLLAAAPTPPASEPATWQEALEISETGDVHAAISNFAENLSADDAVGLVQAVMNAVRVAPTPPAKEINLNDVAMERIHEAASKGRCKDFPPEYSGNDLISDICEWLASPAQEDEPVAWAPIHPELGPLFGATSKHKILAEGSANLELMPLYTRQQDDKLRKAAAQEDEAVAWHYGSSKGQCVSLCRDTSIYRADDEIETPLYTHPADDKLRKAAEEVSAMAADLFGDFGDEYFQEKMRNLRAALEGK